jgi:hypothetical protein
MPGSQQRSPVLDVGVEGLDHLHLLAVQFLVRSIAPQGQAALLTPQQRILNVTGFGPFRLSGLFSLDGRHGRDIILIASVGNVLSFFLENKSSASLKIHL